MSGEQIAIVFIGVFAVYGVVSWVKDWAVTIRDIRRSWRAQ